MIKLTFLGTSDSIPTSKRNATSILLTYKGENILVDCGEGVQRQIRKAKLNPCKITRILITHWHTDHILGLPGLLKTMDLSGYNKILYIYGPKGIKNQIDSLQRVFGKLKNYKIEIREVSGKFFDSDDFYFQAEKMTHGIPCNAYCFVKKDKLRIDKLKLKKSGLTSGPHISKLKQGKNISFNGKKYLSKELTYMETGKKISFVFDTSVNKKIIPFIKNSELLVSEASFMESDGDKAKEHDHLTVEQAAELAKKSNSKKLILTHISSRYIANKKAILKEAKSKFKNTSIAEDFDVVEIK